MIINKYKKIYDEFLLNYKKIHISPWHEISEEELIKIYNYLAESMDIDNEYTFKYFMDYIIKRLNGSSDAHTKYEKVSILPINFRFFDNDVVINYPDNLKNYKLLSINGIDMEKIILELDDVISYGTIGKRKHEVERSLFNRYILFGLPSLRNSEELIFKMKTLDGSVVEKSFDRNQVFSKEELFDYDRYRFGDNATYEIKDNYLIYRHTSIQPKYEKTIKGTIEKLDNKDLSAIDTIVVDIRGNGGGNSSLNRLLIDFIKRGNFNRIICLTDYRVFSGGRYALRDLINLGALTIGEEIGTPLNCFGNSNWINIDNHYFSVSSSYLHPFIGWSASSKEEYESEVTDELLEPLYFKPDIYVTQSMDDYLNNRDSILDYAVEYIKENSNLKGI